MPMERKYYISLVRDGEIVWDSPHPIDCEWDYVHEWQGRANEDGAVYVFIPWE